MSSNTVLAFAGSALEAALARAVALDATTAERIRALEGRALDLTWAGPELAARIEVRDGRLRVGPPGGGSKPDLGVRATLAGAVNLLLRERGGPGLAGLGSAARVEMSGDAALARELTQVAERYAPDVERAFADTLGPVFGPQLARTLKSGLEWAKHSAATLFADAGDFVRDESRDAVARVELDAWADAIDRTRDDVERLAARIARLAKGSAR